LFNDEILWIVAMNGEGSPLKPTIRRPLHSLSGRLRWLAPRCAFSAAIFFILLKLVDVVWGITFQTPERYLLGLVPNVEQRHISSEFDYTFRTNSLGLRGSDVAFPKPSGTQRIIVLGDSFVAGNGVREEETFVMRLARLRNLPHPDRSSTHRSRQKTEVINVGCTGISTVRAVNLYRTIGRRFHPDLVVLAYYVGNDLTGVVQEQTPSEFASWKPAGLSRQLVYMIAPNLYLEWRIKRPVSQVFGRVLRGQGDVSFPGALRELASAAGYDADLVSRRYLKIPQAIRCRIEEGQLSEHRALLACLDPGAQRQALFSTDEFFEVAWPRTVKQLDLLKKSASHDGARFVLVIIPTACQVDVRALEFNRKLGYEVDQAWLKSSCRTTEALRDWAKTHAVPALDLTEPFRRSVQKLYFTEDTHLTPVGQARLAELLNQFLERQGLVGTPDRVGELECGGD